MHHGRGLRSILQDDALVDAIANDPDGAPLDAPDRALLDYALKLTRTPGAMAAADVESLRAHDFGDAAIHEICAVTAYFAFVNRMADGLGVELEEPTV